MSDLVTKFRRAKAKLLGTAAADIVVPYQLPCSCGATVSGIRQLTSQQASCSRCGTHFFILPVNVYPATRRVSSEVIGGSFGNRLAAATRELIPAGQTSSPEKRSRNNTVEDRGSSRTAGKPGSGKQRSSAESARSGVSSAVSDTSGRSERRGSDPVRKTTSTAGRGIDQTADRGRTERQVPRADVRRIAKRTFTPFRLAMVGVFVAVGLTGWWSWHRKQIENARYQWVTYTDRASECLKEGNLEELEAALIKVTDAAGILGKNDREFQLSENLLNETRAVNHLSNLDLISELQSTYEKNQRPDPNRANSAARSLQNGWHIFQCRVIPLDPQSSEVELDLPPTLEADSVRVVIDSTAMAQAARAMPDASLIFAAMIESCVTPSGDSGDWLIRLRPDSWTLLTTPLHCRTAGLPVDEDPAIASQLEKQQTFLASTDIIQMNTEDALRRQQKEQQQ